MKYKSKLLIILTTIIMFFSFPLYKASAKGTLIFDVDVTKVSDTDRTYNVNTNTYSLDIYKYNGQIRTRLPLNSIITIDTIINGNVIDSQTITTTGSNTQYAQLGGSGNIGNVTKTRIYIDKGSSEPSEPSEPNEPPSIKDYTTILNNILKAIEYNKIEITYLTNQFTSLKNTITNVSTTITNSIKTQTTEIKTSLNTVNTSINNMKNDINNRLDATNSHLNDIKKEIQTTKAINKNTVPDISNVLEQNKAIIPENKYQDNNQYFEQPNIISNESHMPDMPDIKKWDDVDDPVELSKDIENITDEELTQDSFTEDTELSQDSFTEDNELTQDSFSKDNEYTQDSFTKDNEYTQDSFTKDNELSQDNFNNTHEYEQTNKFEKHPELEQTEQDYNLRWKSINGVFQ